MLVHISSRVDSFIKEFYRMAMEQHITLDEATVVNKVNRLYDAILDNLSTFPRKYPRVRYKADWKQHKYRDFPVESFHFAFQIYVNEKGERYVVVHDACYDKDYHD